MRGTVVRYSEFRGYGFIKGDDEKDYFVHWSLIQGGGYKFLNIGDRVEFNPRETYKGFQAEDVKFLGKRFGKKLTLKPNPFTPQQPMTDPNRFAGRNEPIVNAVDGLFNHKNLIITGERGIGKSSLAFQLAFLAEGEKALLERLNIDTGGYEFQYLAVDHRCIPGHDLTNIIESLLISAVRNLGIDLNYEKITTEFGIDLKILKALQKSESTSKKPDELVSYFVDSLEKVWSKSGGKFNGLCLLIDEIDCLDEDSNLAPFLKAAIESLHFKNYDHFSFLLAGVTGVITNLITQHGSFPRLIENIELRRMTESELSEIVFKALSNTGVTIDTDVKSRIISLSDRFPEPIHLLGYHSFRYDDNDVIGLGDFDRALTFIIRELKRQEFDNLYEMSREGLGHSILQTVANMPHRLFTVSDLAELLGENRDKVAGVIGNLVEKSVIVRDKANLFKLKDPLFKIYLRWVIGKE